MVGLFAQLLILGLTPVQAQAYVTLEQMVRAAEYQCADEIIMAESSWRPHVRGDNGDSYGLAQRHAPSHGVPPQPWSVHDQIVWFTDYADERYGGWCEAAVERRRLGWW
jgi:hypothetical protein